MANDRQELDRLRKIKRFNELSARSGVSPEQQPVQQQPQEVEAPPQDGGLISSVGEFFTGSDRETPATRDLPEIGRGGLLFGEDQAKTAAITPALLTATDPFEMGEILRNNFENVGVTQDEKGNFFATNNKTGAQVVLNKPGVSQLDILQGLGIASAFAATSRASTAARC